MSYNSYGKSDYYSGGRGGYNDSYHGGSRRGSPRGGGRNYSSRGGNSYYQGGGSGGSSSRYQGNSSYGGSNYNQSGSRNDDSYRTVRYDSPKTSYRGPPSYDSGSKRPRLDSDSRYGGSSGGSSYKGSSYRQPDSAYNTNFSSSLKREYEKSKARDFMFNASKSPMGPPPSRYTRGSDRPFRSRGRGSSRGGYMSRKPYGTTPTTYFKSRMMDTRFKGRIARSAYQVERLRKQKRIEQLRARRRLAEGEEDVDEEKDEMEGSSGEEVEEEEEIEEELEDDAEGGDGEENEEEGKEDEENGDKAEEKEGEENGGEGKQAKAVASKKKKKVVKKIVKVVKKVVKRKKELGAKAGAKVTNGEAKDEDKKDHSGRVMFKLDCPACKLTCVTYREYTLHLYTSRHMDAMKKLVGTLRAELNSMRNEQREEQKTFEADNKGDGLSTLYCEMCKLNYRQLKSEHMRSERHKKMREFLIPICKVCHMTCKSQMAYQNHICSINHLKAVQRLTIVEERRANYRTERENEGKDVNMDNFMVLDSVGSADEDEEDDTEITGEDGEKKKKKRERINVGGEYVKKVTALYCELCHFYLNCKEDNEADVLARHCSNRPHMKRYVSRRDDLALRKKAEKIHRELEKLEEEEKEKAAKKKDDGSSVSIKKEPEESSDEENEEGGGGRRYDRFQAGNATATKKLDIDIDLDEDGKDCELDKKEEEEILGETETQDEDAKEEKIE